MINASIIEETTEMKHDSGRPARLYSLKKDQPTHFFMRNIEGGL